MLAIVNATLVMYDHLIRDGVVLVDDGVICEYGKMTQVQIPEGCAVVDACGQYVGPGLVDIHIHAADGHWFYEEPRAAAQASLKHGVTTALPTLYYNMTCRQLVDQIKLVQQAMSECGNIGGFYMEMPYMNPKYGADAKNNVWKGPIKREDYQPLLDQAGKDAKVWVVAPERENILQFVLDCKKANPDVHFAVGHSEASPQQIEALMPYGLRIGTHHTNATGDRVKYGGCRGVCVDETVNYHNDIYAEMICDSLGIHVDPFMQRLIRKIKGEERLILISDACAFAGEQPAEYAGVTDLCFDSNGDIAGSKLTLDVACGNMMVHTGASIVDVFRYASANPAKAVGFTDRGRIAKGLCADLVICDHQMNISSVILKGEIKYERHRI